ncbi:MAG: MFS transporter [Planctomycetes bacterium]|nr:MFS transporter [Planctomycetota bacterium]
MLKEYLNLPPGVYALCVGMFLNRVGTMVLPFLTKYLTESLGAPPDIATLGMTCFGAGAIGGALVGGHLADRYGRRIVMIAALGGGAGLLLVMSRITWLPGVFLAIFVFALVSELFRPALQAMIADMTPPEKRTHAFGLMYMAINLGFGIGPWLGGMLATRSYSLLFFAQSASSLVFLAVVLGWIPETLRRRGNDGAEGAEPNIGFGRALRHISQDGDFLLLCAGTFFVSMVYMQTMSSFPLFLSSKGLDTAAYGRIVAVNGLLIAGTQIFVTAIVARFDRCRVLVLAAMVTATGFGSYGGLAAEWEFKLAVAIWTLGEMMQSPLLSPLVSEIAPKQMRARYLGVISIAFSGANAIGAPLGGLLLRHAGGVALWITAAGVALLGSACYAAARRPVLRRIALAEGGAA